MKQRILTGWTFTRALYVVIGIIMSIQSVMIHQWIGMILGIYFSIMGIFAFGCAAGNCFGNTCSTRADKQPGSGDIGFEEIKTK